MTEVKLCKDCKRYYAEIDACCDEPSIYGEFALVNATSERATDHPAFCGPKGKHWEAKE